MTPADPFQAGLPVVLGGQLSDLGLAEMLGLYAFGRRDGIVLLATGERNGAVWLRSGQVAAACADVSGTEFLRRVAVTTRLPAAQVRAVVGEPAPVAALVATGAVSAPVAREVGCEVILDALAEMTGWSQGSFHLTFAPGVPDDVGLRLDIADVLERAAGRAEAWRGIGDRLPDPGQVLVLSPAVEQECEITPMMWQVIARIDGRRSVREVLDSCAAPVAAGQALLELISAGLVLAGAGIGGDDVLAVLAEQQPLPASAFDQAVPEPRLAAAGRGPVAKPWTAPRRRGSHAAGPAPEPGVAEEVAAASPRPLLAANGGPMSPPVEAEVPAVDGLSRSLLMQLIAGVRGL